MNLQNTWRRESLYLLTIGMDACWATPLLAIVADLVKGTALPAWLLVMLYVVALWSGRAVDSLHLDQGRTRVIVIYLVVMAALLTLKIQNFPDYPWLSLTWIVKLGTQLLDLGRSGPPAALTIVTVVTVWFAGLRMSLRPIGHGTVAAHFKAGLILFILVLYLAAIRPQPDLTGSIFVFFFAGLLSVSIARIETVTSGNRGAMDRYWLLTVIVAILLVFLLALVIMNSIEAARAAGQVLTGILVVIAQFIGDVITLILTPFGYLAYLLILLIQRLTGGAGEKAAPLKPGAELDPRLSLLQPGEMPPWLDLLLRAGAVIALVVISVWLISNALSRRRGLDENGAAGTRESIGGLGNLWSDLGGFLQGLWDRLAGRARKQIAAVLTRPGADEAAVLSVRQAYARLLRLAARLGTPRPTDRTPLEFLPQLQQALPESGADVAALTDTYNRARYGDAALPADLDEARSAWERIRRQPHERPPAAPPPKS